MSKNSKLFLGIMTFLPLVFMGLYMFSIVALLRNITDPSFHEHPDAIAINIMPMMAYIGITALISIGLLIYYIIHISRNPKFKTGAQSNSMILWILIVLLTGFLGMLAYFIVEIWPEKPDELI